MLVLQLLMYVHVPAAADARAAAVYAHTCTSDVLRKNKVTDNLVKIELDMDQAFMKAYAQIHDK